MCTFDQISFHHRLKESAANEFVLVCTLFTHSACPSSLRRIQPTMCARSRLFASFALSSPYFKLPEKMFGQILRAQGHFIHFTFGRCLSNCNVRRNINGECTTYKYDLLLWWLQRKDLLCVKWSGKYFTPIHFPRALPMESVPREYYDTLFTPKSLVRRPLNCYKCRGQWSLVRVASKHFPPKKGIMSEYYWV